MLLTATTSLLFIYGHLSVLFVCVFALLIHAGGANDEYPDITLHAQQFPQPQEFKSPWLDLYYLVERYRNGAVSSDEFERRRAFLFRKVSIELQGR